MNILVAGIQVPFTRGGAELLLEGLLGALRRAGHRAELVQIPFTALPKERILDSALLWRSLELESFAGNPVDLVIGTKFPSYCLRHANKKIWLIHQHRQAYELYGTGFGDFEPFGDDEALRQIIHRADTLAFGEARGVYTISQTVSDRLKDFLGVEAKALPPPPPLAGRYRKGNKGDYILSVGRLCSIKRPDLLIRALPHIDPSLGVKVVGLPDEPGYEAHLDEILVKNRASRKVEFLGRVSDEELIELYANAFAVFYAPHDEDYGFVTLESFASGKPVITAKDSGGVLDFVENGKNGVIAEPHPEAIAHAINSLLDQSLYSKLTDGLEAISFASWEEIVAQLTCSEG